MMARLAALLTLPLYESRTVRTLQWSGRDLGEHDGQVGLAGVPAHRHGGLR